MQGRNAEHVHGPSGGDDQRFILDLEGDDILVELEAGQDVVRVLGHDGDLLGAEVVRRGHQVAAHHVHDLSVHLQELHLFVKNFAHHFSLGSVAGLARATRVTRWAQTGQEDTLRCAT